MLRVPQTEVREVNGRRCRGDCCRRFTLPFGPEELRAEYALAKAATWAEPSTSRYNPGEVIEVAQMVRYLGESDRDTNGRRRPSGLTSHWYTCQWFDGVSRNCLIYDHRPGMCADYPYGKPCLYDACACHPRWRHFAIARGVARLAERIQRWLRPPLIADAAMAKAEEQPR